MNCPFCNNLLVILELNQVEIDYCTSCHGIWLDNGELELLLQDSKEKTALLNSFSENKNSDEKIIKCPICRKKMEKVTCGTDNKITLDKCRRDHGIWFNEGELEQVVEMGGLDKQDKIIGLLKEMFAHKLNN
ncbi:MAG TPA: zf-TFIIB domain-containing protein [Ignavibacteriaceae bacterium]|nr:zf-TFIIB domain-containing protein [Ignavibacteriaceae bacterium]